MSFVISKLRHTHIWRRIFLERLTEPLHLNAISAFVALFGSFRARVSHDLVVRPHNAYAILRAADYAKAMGIHTVSLVEFGVAGGAGLMNMARISQQVTRATGVAFKLYGFDTGHGMPPPTDYRDHPDMYNTGDFPMNFEALRNALPGNAELVLGEVSTTIPRFLNTLSPSAPIGYIVFDLDYYSSTKAAFEILADSEATKYLPITLAYFDDVHMDRHNSWCGELLAIKEFNLQHDMRKIEHYMMLENSRIYSRAAWIKQTHFIHVLDHPHRLRPFTLDKQVLINPYLRGP